MKRPPRQALPPPPDHRFLVRETLRISADIASSSLDDSTVVAASALCLPSSRSPQPGISSTPPPGLFAARRSMAGDGKYVADADDGGRSGSLRKGSFRAVCLQTPQSPVDVSLPFLSS
ncbi:hypothetical protein MLD38_013366 [Melastoma candidum]|uniref:Uncharacterized protein n=1 Tax=Melastoma candidum TaxID=119954 RepID=A0ACB9R9B5_9MYRT|nr:hypothetical protein MLD38_013366 [Melastoma candidum]